MFWRIILIPLFLFLTLALAVSAILYAFLILNWDVNWPMWAKGLLPFSSSLVLLWVCKERLFKSIRSKIQVFGVMDLSALILFCSLPLLVSSLFGPLSESIRYNLGHVKTIQDIQELGPHESPSFLEVSNWYTDKLLVLPIQTVDEKFGFFQKKYELSSLFLVPIFQYDDAYKTHARAWMAFEYSEVLTHEEVEGKGAEEFFRSALIHFQRLQIREFRYLELYPRNKFYGVFQQLVYGHKFFSSGFAAIYKGQDVDRDYLSAYYLKYFLFLLALIGLPVLLSLSGLLYALQRYGQKKPPPLPSVSDEHGFPGDYRT